MNGCGMYIVVYDICDRKRLKQVSRCLSSYGRRVQKSVFECDIDRFRFRRMCEELLMCCGENDRIFSYFQRGVVFREEIYLKKDENIFDFSKKRLEISEKII